MRLKLKGFLVHPYLERLFWKVLLRKKIKAFRIFLSDNKRKLQRKRLLKYLIWKSLRSKNKEPSFPRLRLKTPSLRFLRFLWKNPDQASGLKPWIYGLCVLVVFAIAVFLAYPLLRELKGEKFERTSIAAFKQQDFKTALLTAQAARLIRKDNLEVLQTLVSSAQKLSHPKLLFWQRELAEHPSCHLQDRVNYLRALLAKGLMEDASRWVGKDPGRFRTEEEWVVCRSLVSLRQDDEGMLEAYSRCREFLRQHPDSLLVSELFWDLCQQSDHSYLIEEATKDLRSAAAREGELSHAAIRRLLRNDEGSPVERRSWAEKLWQSGATSLSDALLCLHASMAKKPLDGSRLLVNLQQSFPNQLDAQGNDRLVRLLNRLGRPETAAQLLDPKESNSSDSKRIYLETIQAALKGNDVDLACRLIDLTKPSLSEREKSFIGEVLLRSSTPSEATPEKIFEEILNESSEEELETIRTFLQFMETPQFLLGFLQEMEKRNPQRVGIKYLLLTCYHRLGMNEELRELMKRTNLPDRIQNLEGERQTCIQKTLYGIDLSDCTAWAELAFSQNPSNQSVRFALALCYLMKNEVSSASALLSSRFQQPPPSCPTQRLIGALTLHRTKSFELSQKWSPAEHFSLLTDAERKLLQEMLIQTP